MTVNVMSKGQHLIGSIPVQNIWLLMAYAAEFSHLDAKTKSAFIENSDELPDLVVDLLCKSVDRRLRQNLTSSYVDRASDLTRVRGRIDHLKTESRLLLSRGKVSCQFSELSNDTPRNQFVRFSLKSLGWRVNNKGLSGRARSLVRTFDALGVSDKQPTTAELSKDRLSRHDHQDKEMIELAKIALELALPSETEGTIQHYQPDKNEYWVRKLFEKAIAGFYRVATRGTSISVRTGTPLYWPYTEATEGVSDILPSMRADIVIDNQTTCDRLVIDTKFNSITVTGWMRNNTLRSAYLYQIYAYLRTQEDSNDALSSDASGMLLHPSVQKSVYESFTLQNHRVSFATVDLTKDAAEIKDELLSLYDRATNHKLICD